MRKAALLLSVFLLGAGPSEFPKPVKDAAPATAQQSAVLAGGCFWGVEAVFERLKGVTDVVSGFAGGSKATAHYEVVSLGMTGHAEAVRITFDPAQITVTEGETVAFVVTNTGQAPHEFVIGDEAVQQEHEAEMIAGGGEIYSQTIVRKDRIAANGIAGTGCYRDSSETVKCDRVTRPVLCAADGVIR